MHGKTVIKGELAWNWISKFHRGMDEWSLPHLTLLSSDWLLPPWFPISGIEVAALSVMIADPYVEITTANLHRQPFREQTCHLHEAAAPLDPLCILHPNSEGPQFKYQPGASSLWNII